MLVFDEMLRWTVVSWNIVLTVCVDNDCHDWCAEMFVDMVEARSVPDQTTFVVMLTAVEAKELGAGQVGAWVGPCTTY
jgi:pentatricopeptide repeat protein